ncbi:MAG: PBP1A family penicillin-binding protein [Candidatus Falkowbacteria bacterium]
MPIPQLRKHSDFTQEAIKSWKNPRQKRTFWQKLWLNRKRLLALLTIFVAFFALFSFVGIILISRDLPNPNQLINREIAQSTKIYDRTGEHVLYEIHGDQKRTLVSLDQIPLYVREATISIEDKNFYKHGGFSIWAMVRTVITNVIYHQSAGGSTLTQQFIKNAVLTNEKSVTRKIKELILAQQIEKKFSKDEILQMYLNEIPYGSNAYGVEAASQKYFGKDVKDISLAEAAILAALPQSPSRYSPYGPNQDILMGRKDYVLDLMAQQGYISTTERDAAKKEVIKFQRPEASITAPHFVMYIKSLLSDKYGENTLEQGGLKIITTIDYDKQKIADEVVSEKTKDYQTKYNANNAALVAIDPKTGQVLAMVGSRDYFDDSIQGQVNVATSLRQPGSSMKPIVYASLFEKGYTPNTILYDVVTNFSTDPTQPYIPHNYNLKEYGPVSIRKALAGSLNIPAVKALYLTGIKSVIDLAHALGYTSLNEKDLGLSLVLGGGEVKLLEHTNAYSAFARDGEVNTIITVLKVEDKNGKTLEEWQPSSKKVLTSQTARLINSVLSDNSSRSFIFGEKNNLTLGDRPVAVKTGTTNDYHDAWAIGYTPSLVTGVWVGNTNNNQMKLGSDGSVLAAPLWKTFMSRVLTGTPVETFKEPDMSATGKAVIDGVLPILGTTPIDKRTGLAASSNTPADFIENKNIYDNHSILYYVDKNDPLGPPPSNPENDPQFNNWESAIIDWAKKNNQVVSSSTPLYPVIASSTASTSLEIPPLETNINTNTPSSSPSNQ